MPAVTCPLRTTTTVRTWSALAPWTTGSRRPGRPPGTALSLHANNPERLWEVRSPDNQETPSVNALRNTPKWIATPPRRQPTDRSRSNGLLSRAVAPMLCRTQS